MADKICLAELLKIPDVDLRGNDFLHNPEVSQNGIRWLAWRRCAVRRILYVENKPDPHLFYLAGSYSSLSNDVLALASGQKAMAFWLWYQSQSQATN
jgi:hypothetical protein